MHTTIDELRTMFNFHRDMAALYAAQGARSKAKAAKRRAREVQHALRQRRGG